ncbi:MAG TPA: ABC transporter permease [Candidatus Acidoferrales bacterium]|nr:ABC transporter permease [Candidatus Acidoferrales bacterium]HEV2340468.1 ABC transporter permease [Candidatus Acidoferrales bacterium]
MSLSSKAASLMRNLFAKERADEQLDDEVRSYVESLAEEKTKQGMSAADALREAKMETGGIEQVKEQVREARAGHFVETLWQDLHYGLRMLRKSPGFTAVAMLTLALGIGANTAIFSLVDGIILRPLPYPHSDRIVHLSWQGKSNLLPNLTTPEFEFIRDHNTSFESLAGVRGSVDHELKTGSTREWVKALYVTDGFFETLAVNPQLGSTFGREFTRPGGAFAAVLTDSLWRSAFSADPNIVGREITLDNQSYTVTGVLPPGFKFIEPADLFGSLHLGNSPVDQGMNTDVIGRLKAGLSLSQAQAQMPLLTQQFLAQATQMQKQQGEGFIHLDRYQEYLATGYRAILLMLLSAVGLLLLIACANVASLLLARATSRQREVSVRLALGAGRGRLLKQFLTEGLILGVGGAAAGLAAAVASLRVFVSTIPWDLPSIDRIGLDGRVLLFTSLVAIAASIVFGLASFFQTRKLDLNSTLKDGRSVEGASRSRAGLLNALVAGEMAVSLMLALGAGLLIESLHNLYGEKLGFNPAHLVLMSTPFSPNIAASKDTVWNFERQALELIQAIPGVQSAAVASVAPLHSRLNIPVQRDSHPEDSIGGTEYRPISANYFSTMGIPILRGRAFQQSDFAPSAPVAVINETLARDWWPGQNPIGDHIVIGEYKNMKIPQIIEPPREVIGVVADVKGMLLTAPAPDMVYVPASQGFLSGSTDWVIRTSAPAGIAAALRKAVTDVAPDQRIVDLEPMTQLVGSSVAEPHFQALLMGTFGSLALLLTLVGVYGVLSFQVAQRTHEIGIRVALGATRCDVWRLVIGKAALVAAIGVSIGLLAAFGLTRLMASFLYGVQPTDPLIFASVAILVLLVALLAAYLPARRAMRVDPMVALRYE